MASILRIKPGWGFAHPAARPSGYTYTILYSSPLYLYRKQYIYGHMPCIAGDSLNCPPELPLSPDASTTYAKLQTYFFNMITFSTVSAYCNH